MTIQEMLHEQHVLKVKAAYLSYQLHRQLSGREVLSWEKLTGERISQLVDKYFCVINHPEEETDVLGLFMRANAQATR